HNIATHGFQAAPWDRSTLYHVFDYYGDAYRLDFSDDERRMFWIEFTRLLFERAQVTGFSAEKIHAHAAAIGDIFGSGSFELYADVVPVLTALNQRGIRLATVSNWPRGLDLFCHEMNISHLFDAVFASAEIGIEKPDPRIFGAALQQLRVDPHRTVHVGDTM